MKVNRREFLRRSLWGVASPLLIGSTGLALKGCDSKKTTATKFSSLDEHLIAPVENDFGGIFIKTPKNSYKDLSLTEFQTLLKTAQQTQTPVRLQGRRHTSWGQSLIKDGYTATIKLEQSLNQGISTDHTIVVPSNYLWQHVSEELAETPRNIAVYTDNLMTTVGGTLAVGGIGVSSIRYGTQIDQLRSFGLLTPDGVHRRCAPDENAELFYHAPGAAGCLGWMTDIELATIDRPSPRSRTSNSYSSLKELLLRVKKLSESDQHPEEVRWNMTSNGGFFTEAKEDSSDTQTSASPAYNNPNEKKVSSQANHYLESLGGSQRIWCDYFLPAKQYIEFVQNFAPRWFAQSLEHQVLLGSVAIRSQNRFPLAPNYSLQDQMFYSAGVYTFINDSATTPIETHLNLYNQMLAKCLELGGRVYRHGYAAMNEAQLEQQFGSSLAHLRKLSSTVDPSAIAWNNIWGSRS